MPTNVAELERRNSYHINDSAHYRQNLTCEIHDYGVKEGLTTGV